MTDAVRPVPTPAPTTAAVVLAAGAGTRFAGPRHKLLTELDGVAVARRAVEAAIEAAIGPVIVITGAVDVEATWPGAPPAGVSFVHNESWAAGQASSLQLAIRTAAELGADAVVVGLADQPFVPAEAWRRVAASAAPIAVATYEGRRRNPVRLAASTWPLLPADGDEGARTVIRLRPDLVEEVPCAGSPDDIDTWEDLASWQSRSSTNSP